MKYILLKPNEPIPTGSTPSYPTGEYIFYEYIHNSETSSSIRQTEFTTDNNIFVTGSGYYAFRSIWSNTEGRYEDLNNETSTAKRYYDATGYTSEIEIHLESDGWCYRTREGCPIDYYAMIPYNQPQSYGNPVTTEIFPGVVYYRQEGKVLYNPTFPFVRLTDEHVGKTWTYEEFEEEFGITTEMVNKYIDAINNKKLIGPEFNIYFDIANDEKGFSQTRYAYEYYGQNIHYLRFMFGSNFESGLGLEFEFGSSDNIRCRYFSAPK